MLVLNLLEVGYCSRLLDALRIVPDLVVYFKIRIKSIFSLLSLLFGCPIYKKASLPIFEISTALQIKSVPI